MTSCILQILAAQHTVLTPLLIALYPYFSGLSLYWLLFYSSHSYIAQGLRSCKRVSPAVKGQPKSSLFLQSLWSHLLYNSSQAFFLILTTTLKHCGVFPYHICYLLPHGRMLLNRLWQLCYAILFLPRFPQT